VTGESHVRMGRGNEDAWRAQECADGASVAVADGVGSAQQSRRGADAAVAAATTAAGRWLQHALPAESVPAAVTAEWLKQLDQGRLEEFATTVLLGAVRADSAVLLAWLGDGLIRAQIGDVAWGSGIDEHDWGATPAMGTSAVDDRWRVITRKGFAAGDAILLATDGVSEDLDYPGIPALLAKVSGAVAREGVAAVERQLEEQLEQWRTPGCRDDRTLALLLGVAR